MFLGQRLNPIFVRRQDPSQNAIRNGTAISPIIILSPPPFSDQPYRILQRLVDSAALYMTLVHPTADQLALSP